MLRTRRFFTLVLTGLFLLLLAAAVLAEEKTTLTVLLYDKRTEASDTDAIRRFEEAYPHLKVDVVWGSPVQKLKVMTAGGVPPDVFTMDNYWSGGIFALCLDLTSYVEKNKDHFENWFPGMLELGTFVDGRVIAIPKQNFQTYATYYNIDHFAEAGVLEPTNDWTWEDFRRKARKLTSDTTGDGQIDRFAYDFTWYSWQQWVRNAGGSIVDETGKRVVFDSPETRRGLRFVYDLRWVDHVMPQPGEVSGGSRGRFVAGQLSMIQRQSFFWTDLQGSGVNAGVVLDPAGPVFHKSMGAIQYFMISNGSKQPDQAFELIKYLTDENTAHLCAVKEGGLPINRDVAMEFFGQGVQVKNFIPVFLATVKNIYQVPSSPIDGMANSLVYDVLNDKMNIEEAMEVHIPKMEATLKEYWETVGD